MIDTELENKILKHYRGGSEIELMSYVLNVDIDTILQTVRNYKEQSKYKNSYTIEFKTMIAERDMNGISRTSIKNELDIHENTIRKFCTKYGVAKKETETESDEEYSYYSEGLLLDNCPKCNSRKLNIIMEYNGEEKYCMDCSSQFKQVDNAIHILNWEYIN